MEPLGLTVGVIGLASLFTSCLECLDLIEAGRSYAREDSLLCTNLAVQKTRLLIWGEAAGLSEPDSKSNGPLEKRWIRVVVRQILLEIQLLLNDTESLRSKYGLRGIKPGSHNKSTSLTQGRLIRNFTERLALFQSSLERTQKDTGFGKKSRWVVADRKKFMALIDQLRTLINGLQDITPDLRRRLKRRVKQDIDSLEDIGDWRLIQEACADSDNYWSEAASECIEATEHDFSQRGKVNEWLSEAQKAQEAPSRDEGPRSNTSMADIIDEDLQSITLGPEPSNQGITQSTSQTFFVPSTYADSPGESMDILFSYCKDPSLLLYDNLLSHQKHAGTVHIYCDLSWLSLLFAIIIGRATSREHYTIRIDDRLCTGFAHQTMLRVMCERLDVLRKPDFLCRRLKMELSELRFDLQWLEDRIDRRQCADPRRPDPRTNFTPFMANYGISAARTVYVIAEEQICPQMAILRPNGPVLEISVKIPNFARQMMDPLCNICTISHIVINHGTLPMDREIWKMQKLGWLMFTNKEKVKANINDLDLLEHQEASDKRREHETGEDENVAPLSSKGPSGSYHDSRSTDSSDGSRTPSEVYRRPRKTSSPADGTQTKDQQYPKFSNIPWDKSYPDFRNFVAVLLDNSGYGSGS